MGPKFAQLFVSVLVLFAQLLSLADARNIGVCYGLNENNLPSPKDVINLYRTSKIDYIRIYQPYLEVLEALRGSGLFVAIGPRNEDIASFASSPAVVNAWVNTNIVPSANNVAFKWIIVGNEVIPLALGSYVPDAMNNIRIALNLIGLSGIKVTIVLLGTVVEASYPPSAGAFVSNITATMASIAAILAADDAPLMINVYPYFAYSSDPIHIFAEYALFTSSAPVVIDGGLKYYNLIDAMVDAFNAALEKIGFGDVKLVVAETGWPTIGNAPYSSVSNAQTYNKSLLNHVMLNGTPKRPNYTMLVFFFEMFNENLKANAVEQNFGFFFPNMQPVYPFW